MLGDRAVPADLDVPDSAIACFAVECRECANFNTGLAVDGTGNSAWRLEFALRRNPDLAASKFDPGSAPYESANESASPQNSIFAHGISRCPLPPLRIMH